jgi:hypothetical protein
VVLNIREDKVFGMNCERVWRTIQMDSDKDEIIHVRNGLGISGTMTKEEYRKHKTYQLLGHLGMIVLGGYLIYLLLTTLTG